MKRIIILILLISNIGFSQTKKETIDWLNLKLAEYTDSYMGEFSLNIQNDKDWGEVINIKVRIENEYMPLSYTNYAFLAKNIESVITTKKFRTDGNLGIIIKAKKDNIYRDKKEFVNSINIYCIEAPKETIIRMQKGIIHLLNLMGNPITTPKELFIDKK